MVKMIIEYEGNLHCKAKHGPSGSVIVTDAPKDNQGKGEAFSPTDLVASALATCIATTVDLFARRKGWEMKGMRLGIEKVMVQDPDRRIGKLLVDIWMPINLQEEDRKTIQKIAETCPVNKSIHPSIESTMTFHWPPS